MRESSPGTSVYSDGHLIIIGVDLGKITRGVVGHVGGLFRKKKWAEVERKFGARDFRPTSWNHFTDHRCTYEDKRYFECKNRKCFVFVRANKLTEIGWRQTTNFVLTSSRAREGEG